MARVKDSSMARALQSIITGTRPKINEARFVAEFLPMMLADSTVHTEIPISNWLSVAITPQQSVDVYVDVSQPETYLYTVPPIIGGTVSPLRPPANRAESMVNKVDAWKALQQRSTAMADQFYQTQVAPMIQEQPVNMEHVEMWNIIRARYSLPLLPTLPPIAAETAHVTTVTEIDEPL